MLRLALDLVDEAVGTSDPAAAARAFGAKTRKAGATFAQVRRYRRPGGALTSARHWDAGGFLLREARTGWVGSSGFHYICFDCNPLLAAVTQHRTRYRFSDFAPRADRRYRDYWDAFEIATINDGWCANAYGGDGAIASVHVGVDQVEIDPVLGQALQTAGSILAEHLLSLDAAYPATPAAPGLTARERDAMGFVAEGKTDWEIGVILGVSEATARFHVDNARRKLGAVNRAHAVARFVAVAGLP